MIQALCSWGMNAHVTDCSHSYSSKAIMAVQTTKKPDLVCRQLKESLPDLSQTVFQAILSQMIDGKVYFDLDIVRCLGDRL